MKMDSENTDAFPEKLHCWNPLESKFTKSEGNMGTAITYATEKGEIKVADTKSEAVSVNEIDGVFEKFVEEYGDRIFNLMYWKVGDYEDAKDLTSEVLLKVYTNLPKFRGESSLYTWAYRIALNHANRFLLKRKISRFISLEDLKVDPAEDSNEYENVERTELQKIVRDAIQQLPARYRDIVILKYLDGHGYEEISEILKIPVGTVKSRLNRAREKLARKLKGVLEI